MVLLNARLEAHASAEVRQLVDAWNEARDAFGLELRLGPDAIAQMTSGDQEGERIIALGKVRQRVYTAGDALRQQIRLELRGGR